MGFIDRLLANYKVSVDKKDDQGNWNRTFQSVLSADIPVQFAADGEDGLSLALLSPDVQISFGANEGSLEQLVLKQVFVQMVIQQINSALAKIQLPEDIQVKVDDAGISINPGAISLIGQPREHLSFESNFSAL